MKKIILLLSLGLSLSAFSQNLVPDETFNAGTGTNFRVNDIHVLDNGKMLIAGNFDNYNGFAAPGIARINDNGSFDDTFFVDIESNNFNEIIVEDDGKIVAVGDFSGLHRFNSDGSFDAGFTPPAFAGLYGPALIAKQGNKYIVTGDFQVVLPGGEIYKNIIRLNYDGTVDATFAQIEFWNSFEFGRVIVQEDSKLLVAGQFEYYNDIEVHNVMRLTADGVLDTTFNTGTGPAGVVRKAVQLPDGKYIVSGSFANYNGEPVHLMVKLNNDGTKDDSFTYSVNVGLPEDGIIATTIIPQEDGKIMISGQFRDAMQDIEGTPDGTVPVYVSRLNADGSTDDSFTGGEGFNDSVEVIAFDEDGKLLAGGMFKKFNGEDHVTLARFALEVLSTGENSMELVKAYPNPVNDMLYLGGAQDGDTVAVYNVLGSRVYNGSLTANQGIDMSALSNGVYIVKLQSGDKVFTQKVIRQ